MSGFLYFVPGETRCISLQVIQALGLGYAFNEGHVTPCEITGPGPNGSQGVVVVDARRVKRPIGYYRESQKWIPIAGGKAWIGWYVDEPLPGPDDLVRGRERFLPGHAVRLGDGRDWVVPVVRTVDQDALTLTYACRVPRRYGLDGVGQWAYRGPMPVFASLWQAAEKWFDILDRAKIEDRIAILDGELPVDLAVTALSSNYAIGPTEAAEVLGLLDERTVREVCDAMIDWPGWLQWLKKNGELAGSSIDAGLAD